MPRYNTWCVTRYSDVVKVVRDPATYSSRNVIRFTQLWPEFEAAFRGIRPDRVLVSTDPPEHTRLRKLAQKGFTPRLVASYEDAVRRLCNGLIDEFIGNRECDFPLQFANRLPVRVITTLVGAPVEQSDRFYHWALDRLAMLGGAPQLSEKDRLEISRRAVKFNDWLLDFVEERRQSPRDDLASGLANATTDDGSPALSNQEVVTMIASILSAGTSTTAHFLTLLFRELLSDGDSWHALLANRDLIPAAVEELLRRSTSVHGVTRTTTRGVKLGGVEIPQAADLYVHFGAANRDPDVFEDPMRLAIDRPNAGKHVTFGYGIHYCLGAPLARLESRVALECLLERIPGLRISSRTAEHWLPAFLTPGLSGLVLEW